MSDGYKSKILIVDDLSQPLSENNKTVDFEILKELYEHCVGRSNLTVIG